MVNGKKIKNVDEITNQLSKIGYISNVGLRLIKLFKPGGIKNLLSIFVFW